MQNILRFILASYVVFFHIGSYYFPNAGPFAVFGFYTLSGFLITKVLNEVYYKKQQVARDFFSNRFLRLYPPYLVAVLFGFVLAWQAPETARYWNGAIQLPGATEDTTGESWLWLIPNVSIVGLHFGLPFSSPIRFSPPSWTTAIEIYFYIFLFIWGARSKQFAKNWLLVSLGILAALTTISLSVSSESNVPQLEPQGLFYSSVFGVSLCFALGSCSYFYSTAIPPNIARLIGRIALVSIVVLPLFPWRYLIESDVGFLLSHYVMSLAAAAYLMTAGNEPVNSIQRHLGDLSYPLFLIHWQVAILLSAIGASLQKHDLLSVALVYVASILAAFMVNQLIEKPIKTMRAKIRQRS